jgi:hypothetical protein
MRVSSLVLAAAVVCGAQWFAAQVPATPSSPRPAHRTIHKHKSPGALNLTPAKTQAPPVDTTPPPPEPPRWPVNEKPTPASVAWDSQGLRIDAQNSSLKQILQDVATATGAKVEGLGSDQRIFGGYGPGPARDVLSSLLQGSGYNVLMIGDLGQGTPRQILLTSRHAGDAQAAEKDSQQASNEDESDENDQSQSETEPQPQPPMSTRPPFVPGNPPRTPQQIMQQMQQRQQRQQQGQPPNNPPN